ncbi:MAG: AIR synthase related protein [Phycisphaerae bacterium]
MASRRPSRGRRRPGPGKWPAGDLARLLAAYAAPHSEEVPVGPGIGIDAAVVRLGGTDLVVASDPVTFAADRIGAYAVTVNANDVAVCGARPRFFSATLLLPVDAEADLVDSIFADLADACRRLDVRLVGGHTECTAGIDRPILAGTMLGDLEGRPALTSAGARPGDAAVLTGGAAIEATALIAREKGDALTAVVGEDVLERARNFLSDPGISVVEAARVACDTGARALHDVTEGGVLTGLWEMAEAAGLGLDADAGTVPVRDETRAVCEAAGIDPLEAIGSGALVVAVAEEEAEAMVGALAEAGIEAARVGTFGPEGGDRRMTRDGRTAPLVPPDRDAIAALYE